MEWIALCACDEVPFSWNETYAVLLYTYVRPGEGRVLEWGDVDLVTNRIRISKAWDYDAQQVKPTKTWETRDVPIEPTLRPLLVAMQTRSSGKGPVLPTLSSRADERAISKLFRRHLEAAGVTRPDLFAASTTQIAIRLRSLATPASQGGSGVATSRSLSSATPATSAFPRPKSTWATSKS